MSQQFSAEVPYQVDNPTDEERHTFLKYLLTNSGRPEDFENIVNLLSPPPEITTICPKNWGRGIKVAVIGAGEAGLSAAFELRKTGCSITVFEASHRAGGRVHTHYFDKTKGYYGDLGAMRISPSHETTWHYVNLFKLHTRPFASTNINGLFYLRDAWAVNDPEGISVKRNIYPRYNLTEKERNTPWFDLAGRISEMYLNPLPPDIRRELIEIKENYSDEIKQIDMLNYRQAYENTGLSQDAIAMLGFLSTFDLTLFRLSLTETLQEMYTVDFGFTYMIDGGTEQLPMALYRALCNELEGVYGNVAQSELGDVSFRFNCPVDGIYKSPNGPGIVLEYRDRPEMPPSFEEFDYCVCAIPFSSLRRVKIHPLFRVQKMQAISELNYEIAQKTFLFLSHRFWETGSKYTRIIGGSSSTDLPLISLFYPSDHAMPIKGVADAWTLRPGASPFEPGVLLATYNWPLDSTRLGNEYEDLRIYDIKRYVERVHNLPWGYMDSIMIDYVSILWSNVQYIWSGACFTKPLDKINFSYVVTLPEMDGKVFFAGEHISQKHAWQQGALQTGMIAANQVAESIKLDVMKREHR